MYVKSVLGYPHAKYFLQELFVHQALLICLNLDIDIYIDHS